MAVISEKMRKKEEIWCWSLDNPTKPAMIYMKIESLIKSGGGNGPMKPRQPVYFKVPNPADTDR